LQNLFPPKGSVVDAQQRKKTGKKSERSGEERKRKVKDEGAGNFLEKTPVEILLSAHARTSKVVNWPQEQSQRTARLTNNVLDSSDSFWLDSHVKTA